MNDHLPKSLLSREPSILRTHLGGGGCRLLYIFIVYYMGSAQKACKITYIINGRPLGDMALYLLDLHNK